MDDFVEIHANFKGMVQGVFFRASVKEHAALLGIKGTVENLEDGSVDLHAVGTKKELEQLIKNIKNNPGSAKLDKVSISYQPISKKYNDFKIVR